MSRDNILTTFAIIILVFTAFLDWTMYRWLILFGVILLLIGWYFRGSNKKI